LTKAGPVALNGGKWLFLVKMGNKKSIEAMPQLDKLTVVSNVFWFSLCFLLFYILLLKYASPRLVRLVMFRRLAWESLAPTGPASEREPSPVPERDSDQGELLELDPVGRIIDEAPAVPSASAKLTASLGTQAAELSRVFLGSALAEPTQPNKLQGSRQPAADPMASAVKQFGALSARGLQARVEQKSTESPRAILSIYKTLFYNSLKY